MDAAVKQRQHPLCLTQVVISMVLKLFNTINHLHLYATAASSKCEPHLECVAAAVAYNNYNLHLTQHAGFNAN